MIERQPVNISTIAHCFDLKPEVLFRWYKNHISSYHKERENKTFAGQYVSKVDVSTGEVVGNQVVHILCPENVGAAMCIDEKMINKKFTTILSNHETGKIALLIDSMQPHEVKQGIELLGTENIEKIRHIASDMSPLMKSICREKIPQAKIVIDKFHVIKQLMEALQAVRLNIKNNIKIGNEINEVNENGWTNLELLEKTKYLLLKHKDELHPEAIRLLNTALEKYPILKQTYELAQQLRNWYNKSNIGKPIEHLSKQLRLWYENIQIKKIKPLQQVAKMMQKHEEEILNYFHNGITNAKAENLNGRIQRFITNNYGARNRDFLLYRTKVYFATPAPQKII